MGISRYLAMTRSELEAFSLTQGHAPAYMACHFSPYSTGLSNIPASLPDGAMVILNDRTPIYGHDPQQIARQITDVTERTHCSCVLLDFERPGYEETKRLCEFLIANLSCPVGVSALYAEGTDCPVFLPPVPMDMTLGDYLAPWQGRQVWLDIAPEAVCVSVTEAGSRFSPMAGSSPPENAFFDDALHCHYRSEVLDDRIHFYLWRDLASLIEEADALGVAKCIGLYQELCSGK